MAKPLFPSYNEFNFMVVLLFVFFVLISFIFLLMVNAKYRYQDKQQVQQAIINAAATTTTIPQAPSYVSSGVGLY